MAEILRGHPEWKKPSEQRSRRFICEVIPTKRRPYSIVLPNQCYVYVDVAKDPDIRDNPNMSTFPGLQKDLGYNIQLYRKKRGWSQAKLAEEAEVSTNYVSHLEAGIKSPSLLVLYQLARALEVEAYQLLTPTLKEIAPSKELEKFRIELADGTLEAIRSYFDTLIGPPKNP